MHHNRYGFEPEEESVLFECKGRFQVNYPKYVDFILNNARVAPQVKEIYRKLAMIQAVRRISRFFATRNDQNSSYCLSPRSSTICDIDTNEEENDIIIIDDHHSTPDYSVTVLESGVFPRCDIGSLLTLNMPRPLQSPLAKRPSRKEKYRSRHRQSHSVELSLCTLQNQMNYAKEHRFQRYIQDYQRLTHDVNRLHRKLDRMMNS